MRRARKRLEQHGALLRDLGALLQRFVLLRLDQLLLPLDLPHVTLQPQPSELLSLERAEIPAVGDDPERCERQRMKDRTTCSGRNTCPAANAEAATISTPRRK